MSRTPNIGYSNQKIKDKVDKNQYLSEAEKAYLEMEATNAILAMYGRYKGRGAAFVAIMARKLTEASHELYAEEQRKAGKADAKENRSLEEIDSELAKPHQQLFGTKFYGGE